MPNPNRTDDLFADTVTRLAAPAPRLTAYPVWPGDATIGPDVYRYAGMYGDKRLWRRRLRRHRNAALSALALLELVAYLALVVYAFDNWYPSNWLALVLVSAAVALAASLVLASIALRPRR